MTFTDRTRSGRNHVARLDALREEHPVIIALPHGGHAPIVSAAV